MSALSKTKVAMFTSGVLIMSLVCGLNVQAAAFSDVNSSTNYQTAIQWAHDQGIISGYTDGSFKPEACVRRGELLKMLYSYNNGAKTTYVNQAQKTFSDVLSTDWFYSYVRDAVRDGVVDGYADGSFKPSSCVNRAEAMKIATNALFHHPDLSNFRGAVYYDDKLVVDIHSYDWFAPYSNFLFKKRLPGSAHTLSAGNVNGTPEIQFLPQGYMTRKEVAQLIYNYDQANRTNQTVVACFNEGQSLGAVIPANANNKCCAGLTPYIPSGIVGTMGTCQKTGYTPTTACYSQGQSLGALIPANASHKCCAGLTPYIPTGTTGTMGTCELNTY